MVMRRGKATEVGNLSIGKVLVLLHKPLLVRCGLPVHPDVKGNAVRGVGAVPKVGPCEDGTVHGMLDVARVKFSVLRRQARRHRPLGGYICEGDAVPPILVVWVVQKTIYRVDVQHVVGNSSGTGIEGIGMKHPAHGLGLSGNVPGVEGGFAQGVPCAIGGLPLHGVHVLRKLAQFVSSWTPSRQLHVKRFARGEDRRQFNARCAVQQPPDAQGDGLRFGLRHQSNRSSMGRPVVALGMGLWMSAATVGAMSRM